MALDAVETNGLPGVQYKQLNRGQITKFFDANAAAAPVNSDPYFINMKTGPGPSVMRWKTKFAAAPDAVSIKIQFSMNNSDWVDLDSSTNVAGEMKAISNITPGWYRAQKTSQTNGGALTVEVVVQ